MQVLLLGPVTVVRDEVSVPVRSPRRASVLAALALDAGSPVSRARLVDAVWGDEPPSTARNTLQVHVSALRRALGPRAVEASGDGYRLACSRADVDVLRFGDLVRQGLEAGEGGRDEEAARLLRSALALWRSDPLGGVDPASVFFDAPRHRLRQLRLTATLAAVDADLALGRHLMVTDELLALAAEHPYDEEVAARRMLAHYRSGRPAEALAVYDATVRGLRGDLGVEPGPELRGLHARVLRHDLDLDRDVVRPARRWLSPPDPARGPLVGREALLSRVEHAVLGGRVHTLVGPSGVGKTRLATEVAARCQDRFPDGAAVVDACGATSLAPLLDRLLEVVAPDDAVTRTPAERRLAARGARALVVLDDLAPDPAMRVELDELVAASRCTFLITSARPAGLAGERITSVPPLTDAAAAELLAQRARAAGAEIADDAATRRLAERCGRLVDGLPLAVELVAPLAVTGLQELHASLERRRHAGGAGDGLTVSFAGSMQRLEPAEADLLDLLVSAGAPVDAELVAAVGLEPALAALVRDGLVARTPGSHGSGLFTVLHQVRDHRARERDPARDEASRRLFVSAAARTAGTPRQYLPMNIADPARARRLVALEPALVRAVELAADLDLVTEAADIALLLPELFFSRTGVAPGPGRSRWLLDRPTLSPGRRVDLLVLQSVEYFLDHQPQRAAAASAAALDLVVRLDDPGRRAQVLANRWGLALGSGLRLEGVEQDALDAVRAAEAHGGAEVLAGTLLLLYPRRGAPGELQDTIPRAVRAARAAGHAGLLALALGNLALVDLERADPRTAVVHAREALALAETLHNRAAEALLRGTLQAAEALAGSSTALSAIAALLDLSWERLDTRTVTDSLLKLAAGARRRGDVDLAGRCLGLYDALLTREALAPVASEEAFAERWLAGLAPVPPSAPLDLAVPELVRELTG